LKSFLKGQNKSQDSEDDIELLIANEIFMKKGLEIQPAYSKALKQYFGARGRTVDFLDKEAAAGQINNWAAENTKNKIMDIVAPGTKLVTSRFCLKLKIVILFRVF
jgi:serine protease inhibitor